MRLARSLSNLAINVNSEAFPTTSAFIRTYPVAATSDKCIRYWPDILPYLDELGTMGQDQSLEGTADSHAYSTRDPAVVQPSLTGLVRALFATQHCVPAMIRPSLRDFTLPNSCYSRTRRYVDTAEQHSYGYTYLAKKKERRGCEAKTSLCANGDVGNRRPD